MSYGRRNRPATMFGENRHRYWERDQNQLQASLEGREEKRRKLRYDAHQKRQGVMTQVLIEAAKDKMTEREGLEKVSMNDSTHPHGVSS